MNDLAGQAGEEAAHVRLDLAGEPGVDLAAPADPRPGDDHPAAPAEGDPPVGGRPEVVDHRPRVGDRLAARPADLLEVVGNRLGDHHVARGRGQGAAKRLEPEQRGSGGEDRGGRGDPAGGRLDRGLRFAEADAGRRRVLVDLDAGVDDRLAQPDRQPRRVDRRRVGIEGAAAEERRSRSGRGPPRHRAPRHGSQLAPYGCSTATGSPRASAIAASAGSRAASWAGAAEACR